MSDQIVTMLIVQVVMLVITGVAGWFGGKVKGMKTERDETAEKTKKERDYVRAIARLLLYYRLKDLHRLYVVGGQPISSGDKHEVEDIYKYYHDILGGNGEATRMYRAIIELKTI